MDLCSLYTDIHFSQKVRYLKTLYPNQNATKARSLFLENASGSINKRKDGDFYDDNE